MEQQQTSLGYPMKYANHQHNSLTHATISVKNELAWRLKYADHIRDVTSPPREMVLGNTLIGVHARNLVLIISEKGEFKYYEGASARAPVIFSPNFFSIVEPHGLLTLRDYRNKILFEEIELWASAEWTNFHLMAINGDKIITACTYTGGPQRRPPKYYSAKSHFEPEEYEWSCDGDGRLVDALMTKDNQTMILVRAEKCIKVNTSSGQSEDILLPESVKEIHTASINPEGNLLIIGSNDSEFKLCELDLNGKLVRESNCTSPLTHQPPACRSGGEVFVMDGNGIVCIKKGEIAWEHQMPFFDKPFITVAQDNSIVIQNSRQLVVLNKDGEERFARILTVEEESFDCPAVIGSKGQIFSASGKALYCIE